MTPVSIARRIVALCSCLLFVAIFVLAGGQIALAQEVMPNAPLISWREAHAVNPIYGEALRGATQGSMIDQMITDGKNVYFFADTSKPGDDGVGQRGIWRSDGTRQGTVEIIPLGDRWIAEGSLRTNGKHVYVVATYDMSSELLRFNGSTVDRLGTVSGFRRRDGDPFAADGTFYFQIQDHDGFRIGRVRPSDTVFHTIYKLEPSALATMTVGFFVMDEGIFISTIENGLATYYTMPSTSNSLKKAFSYPFDPNGYGTRRMITLDNGFLFYIQTHEWNVSEPPFHGYLYYGGLMGQAMEPVTIPISTTGEMMEMVALGNVAYVLQQIEEPRSLNLWRTDGTVEGTALVKEWPGGIFTWSSSDRLMIEDGLVSILMRRGSDNGLAVEYWVSDGTITGTVQLPTPPQELFWRLGERYVYPFTDSQSGTELYVYENGQKSLLKEIGYRRESYSPGNLDQHLKVGNILFFGASEPAYGYELWRTDGTTDGTYLVRDMNTYPLYRGTDDPILSAGPRRNAVGGNVLYATVDNGLGVEEGWMVNPISLVANPILPSAEDVTWNVTSPFLVDGQKVYFTLQDSFPTSDGAAYINVLWHTNGTRAGTYRIAPAEEGVTLYPHSIKAIHNGYLYFVATDKPPTEQGELYLWRTDGTPKGTTRVLPLKSAEFSLVSVAGKLVLLGWFSPVASPDVATIGVWRLNDAQTDFSLLRDMSSVWRGDNNWTLPYEFEIRSVNGYAIFVFPTKNEGRELWRTDGTPEGTFLPVDIRPGPTDLGATLNGVIKPAYGQRIHYMSVPTDSDYELWRYDGTSEGTHLLRSYARNWHHPLGSKHITQLQSLVTVGDRAFLIRSPEYAREELWTSDGTSLGTIRLVDLQSLGEPYRTQNATIVAGDGVAYIGAFRDGVLYIWQSNGTELGTILIAAYPAARDVQQSSDPPGVVAYLNGVLYFRAGGSDVGTELFAYRDGEAWLVGDINAGAGGSYPRDFVQVGNLLYFTAFDEVYGREFFAVGDPVIPNGSRVWLPQISD